MAINRDREFRSRQLRVGLLLVAGVLLLIYGVYQVGKIFDVFADRYTLITQLPSVAGLRTGAPVTLGGQQVGQVDEIEFIPMRLKRNGNHLTIKINVAERVHEQIRRDSHIFVRAQGLLGDKYLDIVPGTLATTALRANDTIAADISLDMEQFLARASTMMDKANVLVADLEVITGSLARGEGTLGQMLHDNQLYSRMVGVTGGASDLLSSLNNGNGALPRMIHDPEMYRRMLGAVSKVDSLGSAILRGNGTISQLIFSDSLYRGLSGTARKADLAAGQFSDMLKKLNDPAGSMNKFLTDPRLFDEFLKSVIDLQTLIADVRANPKKYVPPVQVKVF